MMKCQRCGAALAAGHLYCDICGSEYQIVPDFEPELEISIQETLSGLSESIQTQEAKLNDGQTTIKELQPESVARRPSKKWLAGILLCLMGLAIGAVFYGNSSGYLLKRAEAARSVEDYLNAADWYGKLRQKEPDVPRWYLEEARMYLHAEHFKEALDLGTQALKYEEKEKEAYELLLSIYLQQEDFQKMNDLLLECQNENILQEYAQYLALPPEADYESGYYESIVEVELTGPEGGRIYYTLDGTTPTSASMLYQEPIPMGNGSHSLKAVYVNLFGVCSNVLQLEYEIAATIPLVPVVWPQSGTYEQAENIVLEVEEGTEVYYTLDGSIPTTKSARYRSPLPMPLGESHFTFVAYSQQGIASKATIRDYLLNIKTGISEEEAGNLLVQEMIKKGLILDRNGALPDYYGVHRYFYNYPVLVENEHYYVFAEHYLENEINRRTGNYYAVDVMQGNCFRLLTQEDGSHRLREI